MRNAPHRIEVNGSPTITDVDGIPEYQWLGIFTTHGLFTFLDVEEAPLWVGQKVEASVRVPLGTNVRPGDRVTFQGEDYRVVTTRPNPMHLRVMLRRGGD